MEIEFERRLTARRYSEILAIAEKNLETSLIIDELLINDHGMDEEFYRTLLQSLTDQKGCHIVALDYSISALEAFINYIGYIFCDDWVENQIEKKNFWDQYKRVISYFKDILQAVPADILLSPYADFEKHREKFRNPLHHIHASRHDSYLESAILGDSLHDMQANLEILYKKAWPVSSISREDAVRAFENTKFFIETIRGLAKKCADNKNHPVDRLRRKLLNDFLDNPYKIALVVGGMKTEV